MNLLCMKKKSVLKSGSKIRVFLCMLFVSGCASYGHNVAPIPFPEAQPDHITIDGVAMTGEVYLNSGVAEKHFGFDIRGAGLLPVQVVIDNKSKEEVRIDPSQTFLIDRQGQAWPLLSSEEAYNRIQGHVDMGEAVKGAGKPAALLGTAGALVGLAVGIVSGHDVAHKAAAGAAVGAAAGMLSGGSRAYLSTGEKIRKDLAQRSLKNSAIHPGELAHGFLFFPGKGTDEALSAAKLRLAIHIGLQNKVVFLPFSAINTDR